MQYHFHRAMKILRGCRVFFVIGAGLALASCEELEPRFAGFLPGGATAGGYWQGDDVSGHPNIVVRVSEQRAYFYKGKQLAGVSGVSTGIPCFDTSSGYYHDIEKD